MSLDTVPVAPQTEAQLKETLSKPAGTLSPARADTAHASGQLLIDQLVATSQDRETRTCSRRRKWRC